MTTTNKVSIGAKLFLGGAVLFATGVVVFVSCWMSHLFLMDNEKPAPLWMQIAIIGALASVPLGIIAGFVGGAIWFARLLKDQRDRNSQ